MTAQRMYCLNSPRTVAGNSTAVKKWKIEPYAMSLGFPFSAKSGNTGIAFSRLGKGKGAVFLLCFTHFPEKGTSDRIAHG